MHSALTLLVALSLTSACSLSVGAGAQGRLGRTQQTSVDAPACNSFESCERIYRADLERLEGCRQTDSDCANEERQAALAYGVLYSQTNVELESLREMAREAHRDADDARAAPCPPDASNAPSAPPPPAW
ncbi:MAG: hypothetical protein ABW061_10125 [Polyangiaceae bacterium]